MVTGVGGTVGSAVGGVLQNTIGGAFASGLPASAPDKGAAEPAESAKQTACPKCGANLPADAKFCPECGAPLMIVKKCPNCGAEVQGGKGKFCPECGHKIEQEAQS
jgi:membrane protease subunit (stomatin/prohibitin family)